MPHRHVEDSLKAFAMEKVLPHTEVAAAVRAQSQRILDDCKVLAERAIPRLQGRSIKEFENALATILDVLAHGLASGAPQELRRLLESAPEHGATRFRLQFDLFDLLQEGRILRGVMLVRIEDELGRQCTMEEAAALHTLIDLMNQQSVLSLVDEQQDRLEVAKEASGIGMFVCQIEEDVLEWDANTRKIFGVDAEEPVNHALWRTLVYPADLEQAEQAALEVLHSSGTKRYNWQYRIRHGKTGAIRWVEATGRAMRSGERPPRIIGAVQDVTKRKQTEAALKEASQRKDEFIAVLAHELRNPLAPIRMAATVLSRSGSDPSQHQAMTEVITRQSETMARLIDDLLDVSRISRGLIHLQIARFDLASLIAHASETIRPMCESKGLMYETELPDEPVMINGDKVRLAQVVNNLLSNASRYTPRGGSVRVSAGREGDEVVIRVSDTGPGIQPEDHERIFEMFSQCEGSGGHKATTGLGLGLPLVRSLVQMHGGEVTLRSEVGEGSEFAVHLPMGAEDRGDRGDRGDGAQQPFARERADGQAGNAIEQKPMRSVLIVDDNRDALEVLKVLLGSQRLDVRTAATGEQALEIAEQVHPEVVVLDIGLPDMDGYEVARAIRMRPWGKDVRLIAMTGWGQARDRELSQAAGFDRHVTKPADPDLLEELIDEPAERM